MTVNNDAYVRNNYKRYFIYFFILFLFKTKNFMFVGF